MDYFTCGYNKKDFENGRIKALCNSYRLFQAQEKKVKDEEYIKNLLEQDYVEKIRAINTKYDILSDTIKCAADHLYRTDKKDKSNKASFDLLQEHIGNDFFGCKYTVKITRIVRCGYEDYGYSISVQYNTESGSRFFTIFIPLHNNITVENYEYAYHGQFSLFENVEVDYSVQKISSYSEDEIKKWFTDNIVNGGEITPV